MHLVRPLSAGLTVGVVLASWHAVWLVCVAFGFAQPLIDFVFWAHLIRPVYTVEPFAAGPALALLAITLATGFLIGSGFALVWNRLHGDAEDTARLTGQRSHVS